MPGKITIRFISARGNLSHPHITRAVKTRVEMADECRRRMLLITDTKVNQWENLIPGIETLRVKPLKVAFVVWQHVFFETERMSRDGSTRLFLFLHRTAKITRVNAVGIVTKISNVTEVFPFAVDLDARMTKGNAIHNEASARRVKFAQVIESDPGEGVAIRHHQHRNTLRIQNHRIRQLCG